MTNAFKNVLASYFLILKGFYFFFFFSSSKHFCKYLGCFDTQMFSQTFPPASQPLKSLHRPQPMGKFAREIGETTGEEHCQEPWLPWPQTNVDFVSIPETRPWDVLVKLL